MRYYLINEVVAWSTKEPLRVETVKVTPQKASDVRIKIVDANVVCQINAYYTLDGLNPEGLLPCILGHEGGGVVESEMLSAW